jgi:hypothetical protein
MKVRLYYAFKNHGVRNGPRMSLWTNSGGVCACHEWLDGKWSVWCLPKIWPGKHHYYKRKEVGHAPFDALRVVASSGSSNDQIAHAKICSSDKCEKWR